MLLYFDFNLKGDLIFELQFCPGTFMMVGGLYIQIWGISNGDGISLVEKFHTTYFLVVIKSHERTSDML